MERSVTQCAARGNNRAEWGMHIRREMRQLLDHCKIGKSIQPNTAEAFLKSLEEYLASEKDEFLFGENTQSLPSVKLVYEGPVGKASWEWTDDCWMTPEGKVYVPANAQNFLAYTLSKTHKHEALPPIPERNEEQQKWEPRYIRFLHSECKSDGMERKLFVEASGFGYGLAGIDFG
jgi:hypothetical protein